MFFDDARIYKTIFPRVTRYNLVEDCTVYPAHKSPNCMLQKKQKYLTNQELVTYVFSPPQTWSPQKEPMMCFLGNDNTPSAIRKKPLSEKLEPRTPFEYKMLTYCTVGGFKMKTRKDSREQAGTETNFTKPKQTKWTVQHCTGTAPPWQYRETPRSIMSTEISFAQKTPHQTKKRFFDGLQNMAPSV